MIEWFELDTSGCESLETAGLFVVGDVEAVRQIRLPRAVPEHGGRELAVLGVIHDGVCPNCQAEGALLLQLEDRFWCVVCRGGSCGFVCCRERPKDGV